MAEFCEECNKEHFGMESDFSYLRDNEKCYYLEAYPVLCEGCGPTVVDNNGVCVSIKCELHGDRNMARFKAILSRQGLR